MTNFHQNDVNYIQELKNQSSLLTMYLYIIRCYA